MNIPDEQWRELVAAVIKVYTLRQTMTDENWMKLYNAIFVMRHRLDAIVPPGSWGEYVPAAPAAGASADGAVTVREGGGER